MNRSYRRAISFAALLAMGATSAAHADFGAANACGGSNFSTCASVDVKWTGNTATVLVTNLGSPSDIFTGIGLTGLTSAQAGNYAVTVTQVDLGAGIDPTASWTKGTNGLSGDGIQSSVAGAVRTGNGGVNNGLNDGYSLQLVFQFNSTIDQRRVGLAIHSQSGPADCSTKINFDASGNITNSPTSYSGCGASTVPEPATIGLLTTGLLGMGGAGFFRRRKKA